MGIAMVNGGRFCNGPKRGGQLNLTGQPSDIALHSRICLGGGKRGSRQLAPMPQALVKSAAARPDAVRERVSVPAGSGSGTESFQGSV